jgi:hypothetical protein
LGLSTIWKDEDPDCSNGPVNGVSWKGGEVDRYDAQPGPGTNYQNQYVNCSNDDVNAVKEFSSEIPVRLLIIKASNENVQIEFAAPGSSGQTAPDINGPAPWLVPHAQNDKDPYDLSHVEFCRCPSN